MTDQRVQPLLELDGIERRFNGPPAHLALNNVTFTVRHGEFVSVVGRSGSGKSTLLNLLGLLDRPTGGSYKLNGQDVQGLTDAQRSTLRGKHIGFVFQAFELLAQRTALENVMLAGLYSGTPRAIRQQHALGALEAVDLHNRAQQLPTNMSGGERQRVAIARAICSAPSLLLCDEPTGNLDSENSANVIELLERLNADGMTIVLITHDRDIAARGNKTFHISDGQLTQAAP